MCSKKLLLRLQKITTDEQNVEENTLTLMSFTGRSKMLLIAEQKKTKWGKYYVMVSFEIKYSL
jgi:hypothetical protein